MPDDSEAVIARDVLAHLIRSRTVFRINSELEQIHSLLRLLERRLQAIPALPDRDIQSTVAAVREALMNAHRHSRPDIDQQTTAMPTSSIELELAQCPERIHFIVTDEGPGFDISIVDRTDLSNVGNGFRTMFRWMDDITFNDNGTQIILMKTLTPADRL